MGWREIAKPSISADAVGNVSATRFFRVFNIDPAAIQQNPTSILRGDNTDGLPSNDSLPDYGSDFTSIPGCTLIDYAIEGNGLVADVEAKYATGGITIFPPPDLHGSWEGSFQTEVFQIPFAVLKASKVPGIPDPTAPPGTPVPQVQVFDWAFDEQPVFQTVMRHSRIARVVVDLPSALDIIADQNNKLQKIGSRWYRFEAGDYNRFDLTKYEFRYSFVYDPGMNQVTSSVPGGVSTDPGGGPSPSGPPYIMPPNTFAHPLTQVYPTRRFMRPPFCNIFVTRGPSSPIYPSFGPAEPLFIAFCNFETSVGAGGIPGLGWLQLPGVLGP